VSALRFTAVPAVLQIGDSNTAAVHCLHRAASRIILAAMPPDEDSYWLRVAEPQDEAALGPLIARSIRALGSADYSAEQIEAALRGAFGVDTQLVRDGTYFVVVTTSGEVVACGGWSRRRTLFGSDERAERDESWLDPRTDAAKIRAFFVDPAHARRGLGRRILERSEAEAMRAGFLRLELMATLPGVRLYEKYGYLAGASISHPLAGGLSITFVPMSKAAPARAATPPASQES
jgi:GNAT superfamily N-acetyltransferase